MVSCEEFLEPNMPDNQLIGKVVFEDAATVEAAFAYIYAELRENALTTGKSTGISYLMGLYSDELEHPGTGDLETRSFYDNSILASSNAVLILWNTSYNIVYTANRILEGVGSSESLTQIEKDRFIGEAYFIRAYIHFYLYNLFGEIPYIKTSDYRKNQIVSRLDKKLIYQNLIEDLLKSKELLLVGDNDNLHFRPDYWVVSAFLSRVYLYNGDWQLAYNESKAVINESDYALESTTDGVFLKNSTETLWQLDTRYPGYNTHEAYNFVIVSGPPTRATLSQTFLESFEVNDLRFNDWVGAFSNEQGTWYFPNKYKLYSATDSTEEYAILFRLPELYLIAAESSAELGYSDEALGHLNAIRFRSGLLQLDGLDKNEILEAIIQERRIEFFSEQGHRFFDLKRKERADYVLGLIKPYWNVTDISLPIPELELVKNQNLLPQNDGY